MRLVGFLRELVPCRHRDQLIIRKEGLNLEEALAGVTGACLLRGEISFWGSSAFLCVSRAAALGYYCPDDALWTRSARGDGRRSGRRRQAPTTTRATGF